MARSKPAQTPQAKRRANTEARLLAALDRLCRSHPRPTVMDLSRDSGVGRNAIYKNHPTVLAALRDLPRRNQNAKTNPPSSQRAIMLEIAALKTQLHQLTTENAGLLKRARDAEHKAERLTKQAAELLRKLNSTQVSVLHAVGADRCGTSR